MLFKKIGLFAIIVISLVISVVFPLQAQDQIWTNSTPIVQDAGAGPGVELGMRFISTVAGTITAIRFYKAASNIGTHVGSLWSSASSGFEVGGLPSCVRDALFGVFGSPPPLPLGVRVRRGSGNCGHTGRPVANSHYQRLPVRIERCTSSLGMHAPYYGCVSASLVGRASMGGFSS